MPSQNSTLDLSDSLEKIDIDYQQTTTLSDAIIFIQYLQCLFPELRIGLSYHDIWAQPSNSDFWETYEGNRGKLLSEIAKFEEIQDFFERIPTPSVSEYFDRIDGCSEDMLLWATQYIERIRINILTLIDYTRNLLHLELMDDDSPFLKTKLSDDQLFLVTQAKKELEKFLKSKGIECKDDLMGEI